MELQSNSTVDNKRTNKFDNALHDWYVHFHIIYIDQLKTPGSFTTLKGSTANNNQ